VLADLLGEWEVRSGNLDLPPEELGALVEHAAPILDGGVVDHDVDLAEVIDPMHAVTCSSSGRHRIPQSPTPP
jgi:hypothetical protein